MFSELYCICLGKTAYNGLFQVIFISLLSLVIHWLLVLGQAGKSKAELVPKNGFTRRVCRSILEWYAYDMHKGNWELSRKADGCCTVLMGWSGSLNLQGQIFGIDPVAYRIKIEFAACNCTCSSSSSCRNNCCFLP